MFVVLKVEGDSRGTPTMFLEIIEVKGGRSVCGLRCRRLMGGVGASGSGLCWVRSGAGS